MPDGADADVDRIHRQRVRSLETCSVDRPGRTSPIRRRMSAQPRCAIGSPKHRLAPAIRDAPSPCRATASWSVARRWSDRLDDGSVPRARRRVATYVIVKSRSPIGIRNVSPAVTAAELDRSSRPRKFPEVDASQQRDPGVRLGVRDGHPLERDGVGDRPARGGRPEGGLDAVGLAGHVGGARASRGHRCGVAPRTPPRRRRCCGPPRPARSWRPDH